MIYVATKDTSKRANVYLAKSKKALKDQGFKYIRKFKTESWAIMWINESYMYNEKVFLY